MRLVILDLEYTAWEGSMARMWSQPWEHREMIQAGAIALDPCTLEERESLSILVRPTVNSVLSDYVQRLTGITQEAVDLEGVTAAECFGALDEFVGRRALVGSWGRDGQTLRENADLYGIDVPTRLAQARWADLKHGMTTLGVTPGTESGSVARSLGQKVNGAAHDALFDVRSIAAGMRALGWSRDALRREDFYEPWQGAAALAVTP